MNVAADRPLVAPSFDYGTRARVGMMIPSSNTASEPQVRGMLGAGVSLHITRSKLAGSDEAAIAEMTDRVEHDAQLLADANPDLIVFHCTAATTYAPGVDDDIIRRIEQATNQRATTTSKGLLGALNALNAKKVSLITPYLAEINAREVAYLKYHGYEVVNEFGAGLVRTEDMFSMSPTEWFDLACRHRHEAADVCFLSCAATRSVECIAALEDALRQPVITSNQIAAWHAMRSVGVSDHISGFGALFDR